MMLDAIIGTHDNLTHLADLLNSDRLSDLVSSKRGRANLSTPRWSSNLKPAQREVHFDVVLRPSLPSFARRSSLSAHIMAFARSKREVTQLRRPNKCRSSMPILHGNHTRQHIFLTTVLAKKTHTQNACAFENFRSWQLTRHVAYNEPCDIFLWHPAAFLDIRACKICLAA